MRRGLLAGALLALLLLAAGTVLGTLRVLVLAPLLGPVAALALELPLMLAIAWLAAGPLLTRFTISGAGPRLAMSAATLLLLIAGEAALAALLLGIRPAAFLAGLARPPAWPGLAAQILAALTPLLRRH